MISLKSCKSLKLGFLGKSICFADECFPLTELSVKMAGWGKECAGSPSWQAYASWSMHMAAALVFTNTPIPSLAFQGTSIYS